MPRPALTPEELQARELEPDEVAAHLAVLTLPTVSGASLDHGWLIAELTDGRLTGIRHDGSDWILSNDEFPDYSPALIAPGQEWRIRDIHIFNRNEHIHLAGSDTGPVRGWHLTARPAPGQPLWLRPRDTHLLITAGTATTEQLTDQGPRRLAAGLYRGDQFARIIAPSGTERIIPGPFATAPIPHTRLHLRQYFTQHHSGAVGADAVRYLAVAPTKAHL